MQWTIIQLHRWVWHSRNKSKRWQLKCFYYTEIFCCCVAFLDHIIRKNAFSHVDGWTAILIPIGFICIFKIPTGAQSKIRHVCRSTIVTVLKGSRRHGFFYMCLLFRYLTVKSIATSQRLTKPSYTSTLIRGLFAEDRTRYHFSIRLFAFPWGEGKIYSQVITVITRVLLRVDNCDTVFIHAQRQYRWLRCDCLKYCVV